jgi:hypothetical protein
MNYFSALELDNEEDIKSLESKYINSEIAELSIGGNLLSLRLLSSLYNNHFSWKKVDKKD